MAPLWIGLIRGIGPATHIKMSMADLREGCERAGFADVRTLLATGNLLFRSAADEARIAGKLAKVIESHGLSNPVVLRRPAEIADVIAANPFAAAAATRPDHLLVQFLAQHVAAESIAAAARHPGPERIVVRGREVYIDYVDGVGRSKLTGAVLERYLGQTGTARNWNTVRKLQEACA